MFGQSNEDIRNFNRKNGIWRYFISFNGGDLSGVLENDISDKENRLMV